MVIIFHKENFTGETSRNVFDGKYATKNNDLTFLEFSTTEVTESDWGLSFFNAANKSYDIAVKVIMIFLLMRLRIKVKESLHRKHRIKPF